MIKRKGQNVYLPQKAIISIYLISSNKIDHSKMVGSLPIDLNEVAMNNLYSTLQTHSLSYSAVDATITFTCKLVNTRSSSILNNNL
jgi:hypothetical protein